MRRTASSAQARETRRSRLVGNVVTRAVSPIAVGLRQAAWREAHAFLELLPPYSAHEHGEASVGRVDCRQDAGVRPWRSITAATAAKSGGPPFAVTGMAAT